MCGISSRTVLAPRDSNTCMAASKAARTSEAAPSKKKLAGTPIRNPRTSPSSAAS